MVSKTQQQGTAGAFAVVGLLLTTLVYMNAPVYTDPLTDMGDNLVYVDNNVVAIGEEVVFKVHQSMWVERFSVQFLMVDFHDGDNIWVMNRSESFIRHTFYQPGEFLVSFLALANFNNSRVFTVPITVMPQDQNMRIVASKTTAEEDEMITFKAVTDPSPFALNNFLWEFGDSVTKFGQTVEYTYPSSGEYTVRLRGLTNDSLEYVAFEEISITNKVPVPTITVDTSVGEDEMISFKASVDDSESDQETMVYVWNFNDSLLAEGKEVTHTYMDDGVYTVRLTVMDDDGDVGTTSIDVTVTNQIPVINTIWNERDYYIEGETIASYADISDAYSDLAALNYQWTVEGDGRETAYPFFDDGTYNIGLSIQDDDGASASKNTTEFEVVNIRPYVSLLSAYSNYSISFRTWGDVGTDIIISLIKDKTPVLQERNMSVIINGTQTYEIRNVSIIEENVYTHNISLDVLDSTRNATRLFNGINDISQYLNRYFEILINTSREDEQAYDVYVETIFSFPNGESLSDTRHLASICSSCVANTSRFPVSPLDRKFPATYEFSVYDSGNDDVTVYFQLGDQVYSGTKLAPAYGPTSGSLYINATLVGDLAHSKYYIVDEDGAQSDNYLIPFIDHNLLQKPEWFINCSTWEYAGNTIGHFAPFTTWNMVGEVNTEQAYTYKVVPSTKNPETLTYTWHFGNGDTSTERNPTYTYDYEGMYVIWVIISDGYYSYVTHKWFNATYAWPDYVPYINGDRIEGNNLDFQISTTEGNLDELLFLWDFGDGTMGFGNTFKHAYTEAGDYNVTLITNNKYNRRDYTQFEITILDVAPYVKEMMTSEKSVVEGNNIIIKPLIWDSPSDILTLSYNYSIIEEYYTRSINIKRETAYNPGQLIVYDNSGNNFTKEFVYNVTQAPIGINTYTTHYLYGNPHLMFDITGSLSPSTFDYDSYQDLDLQYILYNKDNNVLDSGIATYTSNYGFYFAVNTSDIVTEATIAALYNDIQSEDDITDENSVSGIYRLELTLMDGSTTINSVNRNIDVSLDMDGDFIIDEQEVLYSNTLDYLTFDITKANSDTENIADVVRYVLGDDADGDGLPSFYENIYGTSDENVDTDGDGLTDGYGLLGELHYGSDGTDPDTDDDGLTDYEEVIGWQIELITPVGLQVLEVTSDPTRADTDNDGVSDYYEFQFRINPRLADTDLDGIPDVEEQNLGTSMLNRDSDFDDIPDWDELNLEFKAVWTETNGTEHEQVYYLNPMSFDSDNDNVSDYDEVYVYHSIPTNADSDRDGLNDWLEIHEYGTDVMRADTDWDGLADGIEVAGFTLPVTKMSGGVYDEDGTTIKEPTVEQYNITVTTDPLRQDTDGDGLTDYEEISGDAANMSDPTSADSDGDGIMDLFDPQKLISDFEPPTLLDEIEVSYHVEPDITDNVIYRSLSTALTGIWDAVKAAVNVFRKMWYWKKSCWWKFCVWTPRLKSWGTIKNIVKDAIKDWAKKHLDDVFDNLNEWNELFKNTIRFDNFGIELKKSHGIPYGLKIRGSIKMDVRKVLSEMTGILNPQANIKVKIEDDAMIKRISIYKDGKYLKTVNNINSRTYIMDEYFELGKDGNRLESSTFHFEVEDQNGNTRIFERTVGLAEWGSGLLNSFVTEIKELADEIVKIATQVWEWTVDAAEYIGEKAKEAVDAVKDFVVDIYNRIKDWILEQFNKIWEGFIRDFINAFQRNYDQTAVDAMAAVFNGYESVRSDISDGIDDFNNNGFVSDLQDTMSQFEDIMDEWMPPLTKDDIFYGHGGTADIILAVFQGSILELAVEYLAEKAMEILQQVVTDFMMNLVDSIFNGYLNSVVDQIQDLIGSGPDETDNLDWNDPLEVAGEITDDDDSWLNMVFDIYNGVREFPSEMNTLLSGISTSNMLRIADAFMRDDPSRATSLNDLMVAMFKPAVRIGYIIADIFQFVDSIFMPELTLDSFSDAKKLGMQLDEHTVDAYDEPSNLAITLFVFEVVELAYNEITNAIDGKEREGGGGDPDKKGLRQGAAVDLIFWAIMGPIEIRMEKLDAVSTSYTKALVIQITKGVALVAQNLLAWFYVKEDGDAAPVEYFFMGFGWFLDLADAIWTAAIHESVLNARDLDSGDRAYYFEVVDKWVYLIYDIANYFANAGWAIPEGPWRIAYRIVQGIVIGYKFITSVMNLVAGLEETGVIGYPGMVQELNTA
ncbi:MAG: PKD domain-containing protein [Candidatus Heimdallarchaeota archaeon]|nr:PKD domain-containing protein [Candidatus Heimdallarchaeota archaeon]